MAYRRLIVPAKLVDGDNLTRAMAGAGMRFYADPAMDSNIEDTLLAASVEGMQHDDLRVLCVLVTWIQIHHQWINADRLLRIVSGDQPARVKVFWAAVACWLHKDRRFARMAKVYSGPRENLLRIGTDFQLKRRGEDLRFKDCALRIPAGVLRDRSSDVITPSQLARIHRAYRHRIIMGPTYRADMWAALEKNPTITASQLARQTYGSFATAWRVKNDFEILA